jgi:hypothetical protein
MAEVCVVNASPLIFLSRGGHLPLLRSVAAQVWVPHAVAEELRVRGADDVTVRREKVPATKNREAGILPRFGGWHHFSRQPAVAMDGTAGVKTERAKGLEPSTSSLGS